jgi:hypothetical protein
MSRWVYTPPASFRSGARVPLLPRTRYGIDGGVVLKFGLARGGNPLTQWLPSVRFICAKGFPPRARPCAVVHVLTSATTTGPDVDGTPSGERGAGRFRGLVFGGTFGGNKADRREPFRQRSSRRPGPLARGESHGLNKCH